MDEDWRIPVAGPFIIWPLNPVDFPAVPREKSRTTWRNLGKRLGPEAESPRNGTTQLPIKIKLDVTCWRRSNRWPSTRSSPRLSTSPQSSRICLEVLKSDIAARSVFVSLDLHPGPPTSRFPLRSWHKRHAQDPTSA